MLMNVLNEWPEVRVVPETQFITPLFQKFRDEKISTDQFLEVVDNIRGERGNKFVLRILDHAKIQYKSYKKGFYDYVTRNAVNGTIADYTTAFFRYVYGGDYLFGDKTPHYGLHLDKIKKLWPEAKIIHIHRDGIDAAESMTHHLGFRRLISGGIAPEDVPEFWYQFRQESNNEAPQISLVSALKYWERTILGIGEQLQSLSEDVDYIEVSYEEMLCNPEQEIRRVAQFLTLEDYINLSNAIQIPRPFPENRQIHKIPDADYKEYFQEVSEVMEDYGYPFQYPNRDLIDHVKELYRGRRYYVTQIVDQVKSSIPISLRNRVQNIRT
jgi:hypothetical protein